MFVVSSLPELPVTPSIGMAGYGGAMFRGPQEPPRIRAVATRAAVGLACLAGLYAAGRFGCWYLRTRFGHPSGLLAEFMKRTSVQPVFHGRSVREEFSLLPSVKTRSAPNHTHGHSAAARSQASSMMTSLSMAVGVRAHYVQMSPSDQKLGREGSREYYWAKDLSATYQRKDPSASLYAYVDVDYYVDMAEELATACVPVVMYTLVPSAVARATGEYSFTFTEKNEVRYNVSGGAVYHHPLWNYGSDVVVAETSYCFGLWRVSVVYNVDRRQIDEDHQLILLTPIARTSWPLLSLSRVLATHSLRRLEVCEPVTDALGGTTVFTRLDVQTAEGLQRSTGVAGQYVCATIPASVDDTLQLQSSLGKMDLTVAQVKTITDNSDPGSAAVLTTYHRLACSRKPDTVYPVSASVDSFQFNPKSFQNEDRPAMVAFMSPLSLGAYVPTVCEANDTQSIRGRVEGVAVADIPLTGRMLGFIEEFSRYMVPDSDVHKLHPVDEETVFMRQNRPSQQQILHEAAALGGLDEKEPIKSFMKKESYAKVTDPRNISIVPGRTKLKYASYLYAFSEGIMRTKEWYAFGKTPADIAQRVAAVCVSAKRKVNKTDLSRCDGRVSNIPRLLEKAVMLRAFSRAYHEDLGAAMAKQHHQKAFSATGYRYATGNSRASGSSETADLNTLMNVFIAYVGHRMSGKSHDEAIPALGIYGGDDGLTGDMDDGIYVAAAKSVGQELEVDSVERGKPGVDFLARLYGPDVWNGETDSMCDAKRQLLKLHLTGAAVSQRVPAREKLMQKMSGFALTDANTPILGEYARLVVEKFGVAAVDKSLGIASYWSKYDLSVQWPNFDSGWMEEEFDRNFPEFDKNRFRRWLSECGRGERNPLCPPLCSETKAIPKPPADVVVGDDIVPAIAQSVSNSSGGGSSPAGKQDPQPAASMEAIKAESYGHADKQQASQSRSHGSVGGAPPAGKQDPQSAVPQGTAKAESSGSAVKQAKEGPCPHYAAGKCNYGKKCKMAHTGDVPQRQAECSDFKAGKCLRKKCKFAHTAEASAGSAAGAPVLAPVA